MYGIWYPRICANVSHCGTGVVGRNGVAEGGEEKTSAEQRWRRRLQRRLLPPPPFLLYLLCSRRGGARRGEEEGWRGREGTTFFTEPVRFQLLFQRKFANGSPLSSSTPARAFFGPRYCRDFFFPLSLFLSPLLSFFLSFFRETYARALQFLRVSLPVSRAFYQMQMTPECSPEIQLWKGSMRLSARILLWKGCALTLPLPVENMRVQGDALKI